MCFFFSLCLSVMSNRGGILLCSVPLLFENIFTHMLFFFLGLLDIERTCKKDEKAGKYAEQGENSFRVDLCWVTQTGIAGLRAREGPLTC